MTGCPPTVVTEALGPMPGFVFDGLGEKAFLGCMNDAALSPNLIAEQKGFVPAAAINRFLASVAKRSGDELFAIHYLSQLSVLDYGIWGEYVLEAPSLLDAILRATRIIHLHASDDRLTLDVGTNTATFRYVYAERKVEGYPQVAIMSAKAMISLAHHYLGSTWSPLYMSFDFSERGQSSRLETAFDCPIRFGHRCLELEISKADLLAPNPKSPGVQYLTRQDVERACFGGPPQRYSDIVANILRQNLGFDQSSIDSVARTLRLSKRTLQRRLDLEGHSFRALLAEVKMQRAVELLGERDISISALAGTLDYATPSHFARAFRSSFGVSPTNFRAQRGHRN